jgi:RNA polymerase sigma-70 factor (ECF subfamily)
LPIQRGTDEFDPLSLVSDRELNVEQGLNKREVLDKTRKLLNVLPEEQREIVLMRIYLDMSFKEIADRLDISINTALGRMRYALINLRKHIDQHHLELVFEQK